MSSAGIFAWGGPPVTGDIRREPQDFVVVEDLGFAPTGDGEHLWLEVEKTGFNTQDVARTLADATGLKVRDVGYGGLKDRNAVTRQHFSLYLGNREDPPLESLVQPGIRILSAHRSARKIQRGRLAGNRFELIIREVAGDRDALEARLATIRTHGVPNGFGEQRFGHNNVARAYRLFRGEMRRAPGKGKRGFYLSAARSLIFNRVLEERIGQGNWNRLIPGDWATLDGTRSGFQADADDPDQVRRCEELDIHPSGPMVGVEPSPASQEAAVIEEAVTAEYGELVEGLVRFKLETQRRPLRMRVQALEWDWQAGDVLSLRFGLGSGSFATSVLRELVDYTDAH